MPGGRRCQHAVGADACQTRPLPQRSQSTAPGSTREESEQQRCSSRPRRTQYIGDAALDIFSGAGTPDRLPDATDLTDFLAAATRQTETAVRGREGRPRRERATETDDLEDRIGKLAGSLRTELAGAIAHEVRQELAARSRATPAPPETTERGTGTEAPDPTVWVQNERTEAWHVVSLGPGSGTPSSHWSAWCGWAFGRSGGFALETPAPGADRCKRCIRIASLRTGRAISLPGGDQAAGSGEGSDA